MENLGCIICFQKWQIVYTRVETRFGIYLKDEKSQRIPFQYTQNYKSFKNYKSLQVFYLKAKRKKVFS